VDSVKVRGVPGQTGLPERLAGLRGLWIGGLRARVVRRAVLAIEPLPASVADLLHLRNLIREGIGPHLRHNTYMAGDRTGRTPSSGSGRKTERTVEQTAKKGRDTCPGHEASEILRASQTARPAPLGAMYPAHFPIALFSHAGQPSPHVTDREMGGGRKRGHHRGLE
jgi:hypothetical protein